MMTISDKILEAREHRRQRIDTLRKKCDVVVSLRVNFPGKDKNHRIAYLVFHALRLKDLDLPYDHIEYHYTADGPNVLLGLSGDATEIKRKTVRLENNHPLGRFFDIDVYDQHHTHERKQKRVCFLCHQMAHICVRDKRHSYEELFQYIYESTLDEYTTSLRDMINLAMMKELDLDPKFGLVTKHTQGSHSDMDYQRMIDAKDALLPIFIDLFKLSIYIDQPLEDIIDQFIALGQKAEKTMYQVTNNVNCYKGLIFHLGLVVMAYGYYISRHIDQDFQSVIQSFARVLVNHLVEEDTFGRQAFNQHQIQGARGEALSGYQHAIDVKHLYQPHQLLERLVWLINKIEDTNLLKRAGSIETYHLIKQWFVELDVSDRKAVEALSEKCIKKGLSFGGSADMLVVSIFFDQLERKHDHIRL